MNSKSIVTPRIGYGYIRVSTYKQMRDGLSMDDQKHRIAKYCQQESFILVEVIEEPAISGSEKMRAKRVKLTALLTSIPSGSVLIVTDISRLSRSLRDFLAITKQLEDKKCQLIAISQKIDTGSPYGRFNANLLAGLSQLEVEITADRNLNIRKYKDDMGEFIGRIPYGWKFSNGPKSPVVEVPTEQAVIKLVFEMACIVGPNGKRTHTNYAIAKKLNSMRVKPPGEAKDWQGINIKRILERKSGPAKIKPAASEQSFLTTLMTSRDLPFMKPEDLKFDNLEDFLQTLHSEPINLDPPSDDE